MKKLLLLAVLTVALFSSTGWGGGKVMMAPDGSYVSVDEGGSQMIVNTNSKNNAEIISRDTVCSDEGSIYILEIDPPEGTILETGEIYTFTLLVRYEFETSTSGSIGINAYDPITFNNLDAQTQNGVTVSSRTGEEIVSVITTISLNGEPVDNIVVSTALFPEGINHTCVSDSIRIFFT